MTLTASDKHHWSPVPQVVKWVADRIPAAARVLEIGPGHAPFPRANVSVDFHPPAGVDAIQVDLNRAPLPFPDKSFDFVYARHVLEDMWNPFALCAEMSRVGKAGYVETPSPIAELCRGTDGGGPAYRGYHHHRFVVWVCGGALRFVSKYPLVEHYRFEEDWLAHLLRAGPRYWNTYLLWESSIPAVHLVSPLDFDIPRDYGMLLTDAAKASRIATDEFFQQVPDAVETVPQLLASVGGKRRAAI